MGRRASREIAMKLLYQIEIQKDDREEQMARVFEENKLSDKDRSYIQEVLNGVLENKENLDDAISKYSKGWNINRISKVDLSISRYSFS